jgi:hypothetical protein
MDADSTKSLLPKNKRSENSARLRKKLAEAADLLLEKCSYSELTIRNICRVSGVSYGSFYNLYESKEDFLANYISEDFVKFYKKHYKENTGFNLLAPMEKAIDIFVCCGKYNTFKGIAYIAGFYSPTNIFLYPHNKESIKKNHIFTPAYCETITYIEQAKKDGVISPEQDSDAIARKLCILFIGITFNWCISNATLDIENEIRSQFEAFIASLKVHCQ